MCWIEFKGCSGTYDNEGVGKWEWLGSGLEVCKVKDNEKRKDGDLSMGVMKEGV